MAQAPMVVYKITVTDRVAIIPAPIPDQTKDTKYRPSTKINLRRFKANIHKYYFPQT